MSNISLLPPNATATERSLAVATARIGAVPHPLDTLWNPHACPEKILSWLAWALSVDDWNPDWPEKVQRQVIAAALKVHRYKGTPGAVRLAVEAMDYEDFRVTEWFEQNPPGAPYTFSVDVDVIERGVEKDDWDSLRIAIWNAKNLRSHLSSVTATLKQNSPVPVIAAVLTTGMHTTIYPAIAREQTVKGNIYFGLCAYAALTTTVYPIFTRTKTVQDKLYLGLGLHAASTTTIHPKE